MGVYTESPKEYAQKYERELRDSHDLPDLVHEIVTPPGIVLAAEHVVPKFPELEGDLHALKLVRDLSQAELSQYRKFLIEKESDMLSSSGAETSSVSLPMEMDMMALQQSTDEFARQTLSHEAMSTAWSVAAESEQTGDSEEEREREKLATVVFAAIDVQGKGRIGLEDARQVFLKLNEQFNRSYGEEEARLFFSVFDASGKESIGYEEFKVAFLKNFF